MLPRTVSRKPMLHNAVSQPVLQNIARDFNSDGNEDINDKTGLKCWQRLFSKILLIITTTAEQYKVSHYVSVYGPLVLPNSFKPFSIVTMRYVIVIQETASTGRVFKRPRRYMGREMLLSPGRRVAETKVEIYVRLFLTTMVSAVIWLCCTVAGVEGSRSRTYGTGP